MTVEFLERKAKAEKDIEEYLRQIKSLLIVSEFLSDEYGITLSIPVIDVQYQPNPKRQDYPELSNEEFNKLFNKMNHDPEFDGWTIPSKNIHLAANKAMSESFK